MTHAPAPTVRFAPSPTGLLHVGNLRTALVNWLFARRHGGRFILRFDDTDRERSKVEFETAIRADLAWLGLTIDGEARQSERTAHYVAAAERLKATGRLYPCYETSDELERRRRRQLARGLPPIYDRAALRLGEAEHTEMAAAGRPPHWRFRLANGTGPEPEPTLATWVDLIRGDQMVDLGSLSDPVLIREDGTFLYTLTSVIDDAEMGITHIFRGEDHVTNTGVQIDLFRALGAEPPAFGHHSLIVGAGGEGLSKRTGALSLASLREDGIEPMALMSLMALIGTSDAIEVVASLDDLAARFDAAKISTAPARFDAKDLAALNHQHLRALDYAAVAERLAAMGIDGGEAFWLAVRDNLTKLADARDWWQVATGPVTPQIEDASLIGAAARSMPDEPWDAATWGQWTAAIKADTGAKGKALFHPLRLALTGRDSGPDLARMLPIIGRERAVRRLAGERA